MISAAQQLFALGNFGAPAGAYLLQAGKAALRQWRTADAVVLLFRGLKVAEPLTLVWAELLVNRAIACAHHGYFPDAIAAGERFFTCISSLPEAAEKWLPYAHHAVGLAYHRMKNPEKAAEHYRLAAEGHWIPDQRAVAYCDLAYDLALIGQVEQAEEALGCVDMGVLPNHGQFVHAATLAVVRYYQGRYSDALSIALKAEELAQGKEAEWVLPIVELHLWVSKIYWSLGDWYHAAAWGFRAAVEAEANRLIALSEETASWLQQVMDQRGGYGEE